MFSETISNCIVAQSFEKINSFQKRIDFFEKTVIIKMIEVI